MPFWKLVVFARSKPYWLVTLQAKDWNIRWVISKNIIDLQNTTAQSLLHSLKGSITKNFTWSSIRSKQSSSQKESTIGSCKSIAIILITNNFNRFSSVWGTIPLMSNWSKSEKEMWSGSVCGNMLIDCSTTWR